MTEEELFEIMKKEFPDKGDSAFCLTTEHWMFSTKTETLTYMLSIVSQESLEVKRFDSKKGWQEIYNSYLRWRDEA